MKNAFAIRGLGLLVVVLAGCGGGAKSEPAPETAASQPAAASAEPTPTPAAGPTLPRGIWLPLFVEKMGETLCGPDQYFAVCFNKIPTATCNADIKEYTQACIANLEAQMPAEIDETSGGVWGQKLGACAGFTYDAKHTKDKTPTDACKAVLEKMGIKQ